MAKRTDKQLIDEVENRGLSIHYEESEEAWSGSGPDGIVLVDSADTWRDCANAAIDTAIEEEEGDDLEGDDDESDEWEG